MHGTVRILVSIITSCPVSSTLLLVHVHVPNVRSTSWLMYGNLLCISLDDQFIDPIWVLVWRKSWEQR